MAARLPLDTRPRWQNRGRGFGSAKTIIWPPHSRKCGCQQEFAVGLDGGGHAWLHAGTVVERWSAAERASDLRLEAGPGGTSRTGP